MATFVLIPGAGGAAWYWHRLVPELELREHRSVAVELPADDATAGLEAYRDVVLAALGTHDVAGPLVVVGQSMGGFTAPLVAAARDDVGLVVLLNAMIPAPGETGHAWWDATGHEAARVEAARRHGRDPSFDPVADFFHDVPCELVEAAYREERPQSTTPFEAPWPLERWPEVPTRVLVGRDDRFFPAAFQRRLAEERLGVTPDEMGGGHLVALSRPAELAVRLDVLGRAVGPC